MTTVNFRAGFVGRFLCSGLEYQIEHHFFPSVSHVHLPAIQPLVEAFCRRQGIPYRTLGWGEAIWKSWYAFASPKEVLGDVESLRHSGSTGRLSPASAAVNQSVDRADAF